MNASNSQPRQMSIIINAGPNSSEDSFGSEVGRDQTNLDVENLDASDFNRCDQSKVCSILIFGERTFFNTPELELSDLTRHDKVEGSPTNLGEHTTYTSERVIPDHLSCIDNKTAICCGMGVLACVLLVLIMHLLTAYYI